MSELNYRTCYGHLHVQGWRAPFMQAAAELGLALCAERAKISQAQTVAETAVWVKGAPLVGRARLRHALRRHCLAARAPRIQEYFNHSWLIERHFQCALPLAAGVFTRFGMPHYQYFISAAIADAQPMWEALEQRTAPQRAALLAEFAREVARMHALGFVHHDLHLRNILVSERGARALHWLDAWRGGPPPQLRRPAYDLACFYLDGSSILAEDEQVYLFEEYLRQRAAQGRPARALPLARATARLRARLRAQLLREAGRLHGRPLPPLYWNCLEQAR